jgi:hypothetical protein
MNDVINHETENCIWYHTTYVSRLQFILNEGLRINSLPSWQFAPEPWIYVSTIPWHVKDGIILEVNLSFLNIDECGWPFVDADEPKWQLRVFKDIPASCVKKWRG